MRQSKLDIVYTMPGRAERAMYAKGKPGNGSYTGAAMGTSMTSLVCKRICSGWIILAGFSCQAQNAAKPQKENSASIEQALSMAGKGRCREALPRLKSSVSHIPEKELKYRVAMATGRCAMSLGQTETAVQALLFLKREFPGDPEVLYTSTHFFSELATRSSQELAAKAPNSPQAQQLEAEAFESQGQLDKAEAQYKKILEQNSKHPGIHYRLGRLLLAKSPADESGAKKEFEEELKNDPENAAAEFMLGETARQAGQWKEAIQRFSRVVKMDESFAEAYLALGMSLNSSGEFPRAIAPLQEYVKLLPGDPAGHYQLATAYARTGRKLEADHEMALQREAMAKNPQSGQATRR